MLLRVRLSILLFVGVILLLLSFTGLLWIRQRHFNDYMHQQFLVEGRGAWARVETDTVDLLERDAQKILTNSDDNTATSPSAAESLLYGMSVPFLSKDPLKHGGIYNQRYGFMNIDGSHDGGKEILTSDLYRQIVQSDKPLHGIDLLDSDNLVFWYATLLPYTSIKDPTILMLAYNIKPALEKMRTILNADIFMLDLHRGVLAGTDNELWNQLTISPFLRESNVFRTNHAGQDYMVGVIPLQSYDRHPVSALVIVRNVTEVTNSEFLFTLGWLTLCIFLIVLLTTNFFFYIRHALLPIEKAVDVLDSLSRGNHSELPDFGGNEGQDEAGKITLAVSALRDEMITLDSLREERIRQRRRQETLIRDRLLSLAKTLDEESRADIVQELDQVLVEAATDADHNELAGLATILGRMSNLISSQRQRLLSLLRELHEAIEGKARLASLEQELEIARNMQLSILPRNVPLPPSVTIAATMVPAKEVGGDFYDYFMLDEQHLAIVVADVSGKGVPAAFFMAISRTLLKANALFLHSPAACINRLNQVLCLENEHMMFVTAFYGILNLKSGEFMYVNAGHNPPVKLDLNNRGTFFPYTKGVPLAVVEDYVYVEEKTTLKVGESIVFYTDGVTEALNDEQALFGQDRFKCVLENISEADRDKVPECVIQALGEFSEGTPQADDITCVIVRFCGNEKSEPGK